MLCDSVKAASDEEDEPSGAPEYCCEHSYCAAGTGHSATACVHKACIHLSQVGAAHRPGRDSKREANQQTEQRKCENHAATMRLLRGDGTAVGLPLSALPCYVLLEDIVLAPFLRKCRGTLRLLPVLRFAILSLPGVPVRLFLCQALGTLSGFLLGEVFPECHPL